jgi:hypothetical protein
VQKDTKSVGGSAMNRRETANSPSGKPGAAQVAISIAVAEDPPDDGVPHTSNRSLALEQTVSGGL